MAGIFPDLENDIFISYRKNDNKYDGWITEFVDNLKKELESTIKDKVTIYFDENPVDGLLETHVVDKSLNKKLRTLIFMPVLSQTYCDPNCFAWNNEFLMFNEISKGDSYKNEVDLRDGNVAKRILPIKIHELDSRDMGLLQEVLGSHIRSVDFIYKEPGVNRPLRPEDNENKNLNKTRYRNQINKVANFVKEMISSLQNDYYQIPFSEAFSEQKQLPMKSIAVLPFVNMSNDPEQEFFSDGISEEIINTLVQLPSLKVAGRTSSFSFKNKNLNLRSIGEELNVNSILEGSVRKSGNRIRITAQLIEVETGFHMWSQKYDRELSDVFEIQDEIAKSIVEKLQVALEGNSNKQLTRSQTSNVDAYQLYLKGRSFFYKRGLHMFEGLRCFEEALKLDPEYALAMAGLADSYTMLCLHGYLSPEEAWPKASSAGNIALSLAPDLAEVHSAIATIALLFEHNWERSEKEYLRALELNPHYIQSRCWYACFYLQVVKNDFVEGLKNARLAAESDPLSAYAQIIISELAALCGYYEESISAGQRAVELDQEAFASWHFLGFAYHSSGDLTAAYKAYKHAIDISGRHIWAIVGLISLLCESGSEEQVQEAHYLYTELITKEKISYVSPAFIAQAALSLNKEEEAMNYAKIAFKRHDPLLLNDMPRRPKVRNLRSTPGFIELFNNIGLK